ncbi:hypothetical protein GOBAR_AA29334 [Gossypium barbadense]|uniref:Uncharacterized protein n=1 Tax=Gossypium barbadense TaxID=3634 RepID=A0A2P5WJS6_GOSBA|nr:hypothetical protein GOBAR_AA29334 [Gossypium barbadense]
MANIEGTSPHPEGAPNQEVQGSGEVIEVPNVEILKIGHALNSPPIHDQSSSQLESLVEATIQGNSNPSTVPLVDTSAPPQSKTDNSPSSLARDYFTNITEPILDVVAKQRENMTEFGIEVEVDEEEVMIKKM